VHVPAVRLAVVPGVVVVPAVVIDTAVDDGEQVLADLLGNGAEVGPLGAVGPAHEMAGAGIGQLALDEGEQHPVGAQVLRRSLDDGAHQRLGPLGRAHQRGRDPLQRGDHPAQPLGVGAVLGEVVRLAGAQAGQRFEVRPPRCLTR
jgi:hypothetical protein